MYLLFGDTDFTARLAPALMGTAMVPLAALLRGQLGRVSAFAAAVGLAFGPSYLYYGRFAREDIYIACITLALLAVTFRFLDRPRRHQPALIGALLALSFATKESTFITVFVAGTFLVVALAVQWRRHGLAEAPLLRAIRAVGWEAWVWSLATFAAVFTLLFTVFLTNPAGPVGRPARRARLLARPARRGPRREGVVLLPRRPVRRGVAGAAARRGRGDRRAAPSQPAASSS